MKKILSVIALSSLLIPAIASAELSYDSVGVDYIKMSQSGTPDLTMLGLSVSKGFSNNIFLGGSFGNGKQSSGTSFGDVTVNDWSLGAGYHTPLQTNLDLIISVNFEQATAKLAGVSVTGNGHGISIGVRNEFTPQFEGSLTGTYTSSSVNSSTSTSTGFDAELGFKITPQFQLVGSLGTDSSSGTNTTTTMLGGRFFY
jgi:hypothetical protein